MLSSPDNEVTRPLARAELQQPSTPAPRMFTGISSGRAMPFGSASPRHTRPLLPDTMDQPQARPNQRGLAPALTPPGNMHSGAAPGKTHTLTHPSPIPVSGPLSSPTANRAGGNSFSSFDASYPQPGQLLPNRTRTLTGSLNTSGAIRTVTGHLATGGRSPHATRSRVVIRAGTLRKKTARSGRRPRRPLILGTIMCVSIATLLLALFISHPLGIDSPGATLTQSINTMFSNGPLTSFNPPRHLITPSPVPPSLIDEGKCGDSSIWGTCAGETTNSGVIGTGQMESPLKDEGATITQDFGVPEYQYWCGCYRPHSGIDLAAPYGAPVKAADSGEVIWVGWDDTGLGYGVKISHGNYVATIYGHLYRYIVEVGTTVQKGDVIGYEGSTGQSTGPHVHFMVLIYNRWVNPKEHVSLP